MNNKLKTLANGIVATIGFNSIPFKAYIIVAALSALAVAALLTLMNSKEK